MTPHHCTMLPNATKYQKSLNSSSVQGVTLSWRTSWETLHCTWLQGSILERYLLVCEGGSVCDCDNGVKEQDTSVGVRLCDKHWGQRKFLDITITITGALLWSSPYECCSVCVLASVVGVSHSVALKHSRSEIWARYYYGAVEMLLGDKSERMKGERETLSRNLVSENQSIREASN